MDIEIFIKKMKKLFTQITFLLVFGWSGLIKAAPIIYSFSPVSGNVGSTVFIYGRNFSIDPANDIVYFGATQATIVSSSASKLEVLVPSGATNDHITVISSYLSATSPLKFIPTFPCGGTIDAQSFDPCLNLTVGGSLNASGVGDLNNDNLPDIVVSADGTTTGEFYVSRNTQGLTFKNQKFKVGKTLRSVTLGDLNGDGWLDLIFASPSSERKFYVCINSTTTSGGVISFAAPVTFNSIEPFDNVAIADFNKDGKMDLAFSTSFPSSSQISVSIYQNSSTAIGAGANISFLPPVNFVAGNSYGGKHMVNVGDFDKNGIMDFIVTNSGSLFITLFMNNSASTDINANWFARVDLPAVSYNYAVSAMDFDKDGKLDFALTSDKGVSVYLNKGGSFAPGSYIRNDIPLTSGGMHLSIGLGDIDGDSWPDIVCYIGNDVKVAKNLGASNPGGFSNPISFSDQISGSAYSFINTNIVDLDEDGKPEIAVISSGSTAGIFKNKINVGGPALTVSPSAFICPGGPRATLTAGGATTYKWFPSTGLNTTVGATVTAKPTVTTVYTVTGKDNAGCTDSKTVTVTVNTLPTITLTADVVICDGTSTVLSAGGATSYSWSPAIGLSATTDASVTAKPTTTTVYTVIGTDANGCQNSKSVTVTVNPKPTVTVSPNVAICSSTSTSLTAAGASTYIWSPTTGLSATTGASVTASPNNTITYNVTGTDVNGCKKTRNVTVTVLGPPTITSFTPEAGKIGDVITITGTNFSPTKANNIVYFGAEKTAVPLTASTTQLTVKVPAGASYNFITVTTNCNLTAYSPKKFITTFCGNGGGISQSPSSFDPYVNYSTAESPIQAAIGDLNLDGLPDVILSCESGGTDKISILKNTSSGGTISFAPHFEITSGSKTKQIALGDLDGDGLLDMVAAVPFSNAIFVYKNISTTASILFDQPIQLSDVYFPEGIAINDLNADGKPDIVATNTHYNDGANGVMVFQNNSTNNTGIAFLQPLLCTTNGTSSKIAIGDFDDDTKPDLAIINYIQDVGNYTNFLSVFKNTSAGIISFAPKVDFNNGENNSYNISTDDIDRDGKLDIVLNIYHQNKIAILKNTTTQGVISSSAFTSGIDLLTSDTPLAFAVGDIDGDNLPDIGTRVYRGDGKDEFFRNQSTPGTLSMTSGVRFVGTDPNEGATTYSYISDLNGDGKPEYILVNGMSSTVSIMKNTTAGVTGCTPKSLIETTAPIDGVESNVSKDGLLYPNPTSGKINIFPIAGNEKTTITIFDMFGRTVFETVVIDNDSVIEVDLSGQPEGIYFVRLVNGSNSVTKKIIKQ